MVAGNPTVVLGGVSSRVGKTSVSVAIAAALRRRGVIVQPFKVGPDFLDPTYLARASGRRCYNLDGWMMGRDAVRASFARRSVGEGVGGLSRLNLVEGAMGLLDGADPQSSDGSTAEVAALLGAPLVLVIDARGMSRSIAAIVKGCVELVTGTVIAGVVLNHVGSPRHAAWLEQALRSCGLPPVLGAIPSGALPALPSRHLGLVTADEGTLTPSVIAELADGAERYLALDTILGLAGRAAAVREQHMESPPRGQGRPLRVGVARDCAFHFYYEDNLEALTERGADLIELSPLADPALPENLDVLYLGGGYPELHAAALAANRSMRESVRAFADRGGTIYAECGGLVYLSRRLRTLDGREHEMAGLLPTDVVMNPRRAALGYVEVQLAVECPLGPPGTVLRGHEFHYTALHGVQADSLWSCAYRLQRQRVDAVEGEGFVRGKALASYVHLHFATRPEVVDHLLGRSSQRRAHRWRET